MNNFRVKIIFRFSVRFCFALSASRAELSDDVNFSLWHFTRHWLAICQKKNIFAWLPLWNSARSCRRFYSAGDIDSSIETCFSARRVFRRRSLIMFVVVAFWRLLISAFQVYQQPRLCVGWEWANGNKAHRPATTRNQFGLSPPINVIPVLIFITFLEHTCLGRKTTCWLSN